MATIPYWEIGSALKSVFDNNVKTLQAKTELESALIPTLDINKQIAIYLKDCSRETFLLGQTNNARECFIAYELECRTYHAGSLRQSFQRRDALIGNVEWILQQTDTLNELKKLVTDTQIISLGVIDTQFETPQNSDQMGFISTGIITINIKVFA